MGIAIFGVSEVPNSEAEFESGLIYNSDSKNSTTEQSSQKQNQDERSQPSHSMEHRNRIDVREEVTQASTVSILEGSNENSFTQIRDLD